MSAKPSYNGVTIKKMNYNGQKVKKWYHDGVRVFSAGNIVTYVVDSGVTYQEEVDNEASCLSPTTFTPSKSGWTFVGWREDGAANGSVLTSKVMGDDPITLYAVFAQTVALTYYTVSDPSAKAATNYKYYNNGNLVNPRFTLTPVGYGSEWTFRGWTTGTAADAGVSYSAISNTEFSSSTTLYILLQRPVTLTYVAQNGTSSETKYVYLNSYGANTVSEPSFTAPTISAWGSWSPAGWATFTSATGRAELGSGGTVTKSYDTTYYALYNEWISVTRWSFGEKQVAGPYQRRYNSAGYTNNPVVTIYSPSVSGWNFLGWSTTEGSSEIVYTDFTNVELGSSVTLYAVCRSADTTLRLSDNAYYLGGTMGVEGNAVSTTIATIDGTAYSSITLPPCQAKGETGKWNAANNMVLWLTSPLSEVILRWKWSTGTSIDTEGNMTEGVESDKIKDDGTYYPCSYDRWATISLPLNNATNQEIIFECRGLSYGSRIIFENQEMTAIGRTRVG